MNNIQSMSREQRRAAAKYCAVQAKKYPAHLVEVPPEEWPHGSSITRNALWRSREYLVQEFAESTALVLVRLSISRTQIDKKGGWSQDIAWEDLQRLKGEAGYGGFDALEVYPADKDVVNVANMRHLWVMRDRVPFAWRSA